MDGGFLQSDFWADFHRLLKHRVFEFGDSKEFRALVIEQQLPLVGKYWFVPRGPVCSQNQKIIKKYLVNLIESAKKNHINWIRIEPQTTDDFEKIKIIMKERKESFGLVKSAKDHQPKQTLMLDLDLDKKEILTKMKSKTRYNIHLAERKGVKIIESKKEQSIQEFLKLLKITAKRDGIVNHEDEHYTKLINSSRTKLFLADYQNKFLAGALVGFYGGVATYLHGASSNYNRNVMAPFLLQWEIIKKAKQLGMKKYDWGGTKLKVIKNQQNKIKEIIPEKGNWQGISRFKIGFAPKTTPVNFPGCWDIVLNPFLYWGYLFLQKIKTKVKRLKH